MSLPPEAKMEIIMEKEPITVKGLKNLKKN